MSDTFFVLVNALCPLYILIGLGFIAGRWFNVDRSSLASLGIYILMPVVTFGYVAQMDLKLEYLALPIIFYAITASSCFIWLFLGRKIYPDGRANLLSLSATCGNTGYFGLPLAFAVLPEKWVAVYIFINMGAVLLESTVVYYIAARGQFSVKESLIKLAKFPTIYTVVLAIIWNKAEIGLSENALTFWGYFKGSYVVIGMMILGAILSTMDRFVWAPRFVSVTFLNKFILLPATVLGLIWLDIQFLQLFPVEVYKAMFVVAIVPTGMNIAAFALEMNLNPEKAASTILLSTLFGLISVPMSLLVFERFMALMS